MGEERYHEGNKKILKTNENEYSIPEYTAHL